MKKSLVLLGMILLILIFSIGVYSIDTTNVISSWKCDESSGTYCEDTIRDYNMSAATATENNWITGKSGNAMNITINTGTPGTAPTTNIVGFDDITTEISASMWVMFIFNAAGGGDQRIGIESTRDSGSTLGIHSYWEEDTADFRTQWGNGATWDIQLTPYDFQYNVWYHIVHAKEDDDHFWYINGTSIKNLTGINPTDGNTWFWGTGFDGDDIIAFDEVTLYNITLSSTDVADLYNDGDGFFYPFTPPPANVSFPVYEYPTPADGSTNNTQAVINVSCATGNITLWFDNNANPVTKVLDTVTSPANYTTSIITEGTYYYKGSCNQGLNNGSIRSYIYDITSPAITINPNNAFTQLNTTPNRYLDNITLDINFTDNIDLFALNVLFTWDTNGSVFYNFTNSSLSGLTTYNLIKYVDVSSWPTGNFTVDVSVSDSHTDKYINPYKTDIKNKKIEFETDNNNKIKIYTDEDSTPTIEKKTDRYEFNFEFIDKTKKDRIFYVECDHDLYYLEESDYPAHLVCFNPDTFEGNWIDFSNDENIRPEVVKEDWSLFTFWKPERYKITFKDGKDNYKFKSIGGLNVLTSSYIYTRSTLSVNATSDPRFAVNGTNILGQCKAIEGLNSTVAYDWQWFLNGELFRQRNSANFSYCYQEFANQTSSCGGLATGVYNFVDPGDWSAGKPKELFIDGDWDTFGLPDAPKATATNINYTKIVNSLGAIWTVQSVSDDGLTEVLQNLTIPNNCWNYSETEIVLRAESFYSVPFKTTWFCFNGTGQQLLSTINHPGLSEEAIYWRVPNWPTDFVPQNQTVTLDTILANDTNLGQNYTFSCRAVSNNLITLWDNSTPTQVIGTSIDDCTFFDYPILNYFYRDEVTTNLLNSDIGYDLLFSSDVNGNFVLSGTFTDSNNNSFCTNFNDSVALLKWNVTGETTVSSTGYATRINDLSVPFEVGNTLPTNRSFYLIRLNESSTVVFTWLTTAFQPIDGTMIVYRCNGDGTRTLVAEVPIIDSLAEANIELLNVGYSYEVRIGNTVFTDSEAYTKCHIETQTERTYFVKVEGEDIVPILGMFAIPCNLSSQVNNQAFMKWGTNPESSSTITGCLTSYTTSLDGSNQTQQFCTSSTFSLNSTFTDPGISYTVKGTLEQNDFEIECGEITYNPDTTTADMFGLMGIFSIGLLIAAGALLFSSTGESQIMGSMVAIFVAWFLGIFPFGWPVISAIVALELIIIWIGRYSRQT